MEKYKRPPLVDDKLYRDVSTSDTTTIADVPWKKMFTDTLLQALIQEGINNNLDLKVAVARMAQADANFRQSIANFFPSLTANGSAAFQKLSPSQIGRPQVIQAYLASSWEIGVWGKLRGTKTRRAGSLITK